MSGAKAALEGIRRDHPDADLAWIPLDLTSLKSVEEAATLVSQEPRLDVLVNNAGVMIPPSQGPSPPHGLPVGD